MKLRIRLTSAKVGIEVEIEPGNKKVKFKLRMEFNSGVVSFCIL